MIFLRNSIRLAHIFKSRFRATLSAFLWDIRHDFLLFEEVLPLLEAWKIYHNYMYLQD